ncbi:inovirus-type Gp2 protein [Shewanella sp. GutDb-MelDb]|uniref:YagK/YfjJ domain-containing protein n=1 Tax=Shewanella sp. GutDb-MelDb TaxID=2058316 RepID=UPI000C7D46D3|nr:inovirus-type Gp2 protein [Shewanella sp. GutDb-MelDb]PKG55811.1 hypothetical protein CXF82_18425 [Shewanella sp. GutDb-MelDb]
MSLILSSTYEIEDTEDNEDNEEKIDQAIDVVLGGIIWKVMFFTEGLNRKLLNSLYKTLTTYISWHSKVLMIRFDVSLYDSSPHNKTISKLRNYMLKQLNKHYNSKADFGWVREQNQFKDMCHYHCFILLDGQKVRSSHTSFNLTKKAQELIIDINIHFPKYCTYMLLPKSIKTIQAALYRLSYLSKKSTKKNNPALAKSYYFNRTKL